MPIETVSQIEADLRTQAKDLTPPDWSRSTFLVPLILFGLTLAMFGGILLSPVDRILSQLGTDLSSEFVYWRQFGFEELRAGHIPLWNPHVFSGVPFMGGFQSALLYPANLIYLVLPLSKAINCEIALHVFLLGLFMAMWIGRYHLHPLAALLASAAVMFGGAFFLHIYAGHLATMDAMAWVPLILLTIDELVDDPRPQWIFVGIFAFVMQLLAGHPQTVFNTVITCAAYGAMRLKNAPHPWQTLLAVAIVGAASAIISAVQLWTGLQAASEGTRHGGVPFGFASSLSFPPENFLTLLVPGFFGNLTAFRYWGSGYFWEMCPFFGLSGLSMAIFGLTIASSKRAVWSAMVILLFGIALAGYTPLFLILYRYVPGFNHFRSHCKFIFEAALFLAMLTAFGMDGVLQSTRGAKVGAMVLLGGALVIGGVGVGLRYGTSSTSTASIWRKVVSTISTIDVPLLRHPGQSWGYVGALAMSRYTDFVAKSRQFAGSQCLIGGTILLVLGLLLFLRTFNVKAAYALALFGIAEVFVFAHSTLTSFPLRATIPTSVHRFLADHPGDYRILERGFENSAMITGAEDIWGYDPMVLRRYAQLLTYSQGGSPEHADMYVHFRLLSPLLRLIRLRFVFFDRRASAAYEMSGALPHLLLVSDWLQIADSNRILSTLSSRSFDPLKTAILETKPDPLPISGELPGSAELLSSDTDSLVISALVGSPTLLLITDCYSRYWRAVALPGSGQRRYQVLPADYTLMAVPLSTGRHLIRLEYAPSGYLIGRWVSVTGLAAYLAALCMFLWCRRRTDQDYGSPDVQRKWKT
jgi:hypothetical protein